ncbi:hypothetical protein V2A60_001786 [Cordyceps javanica]
MNLHAPLHGSFTIRVCSLLGSVQSPSNKQKRLNEAQDIEATQFGQVTQTKNSSIPVERLLAAGGDAAAAASKIATYMIENPKCGAQILFSKSESAYVGMYIGADIVTDDVGHLFDQYSAHFKNGIQSLQTCNTAQQFARTAGVIAVDGVNSLDVVRRAVQNWAQGGCLDHTDAPRLGESVPLTFLASSAPENGTMPSTNTTSPVQRRSECRAIQVVKGDGCASLASKCNIRGAHFIKFNPKENLCATLQPKQWVCCSQGAPPEPGPQPQPDGTCTTHKVDYNDDCWRIGDLNGLKSTDIEKLNKKTWGSLGCDRLQVGQIICVGKGNTPMPAQLPGVACGPQKIGTERPSGKFTGEDLAKLNQCPLNACCSGWGYCGISEDFCIESPADSGAPGAFKPGKNGCISNCGMDVVGNTLKPSSFANLGYFQGYNPSRVCLRMDATELMTKVSGLTHVHFAFAVFTDDFEVKIPDDTKDQFKVFMETPLPFNKIISFGGWAASTEPRSYHIFRNAVKPQNRQRVAENVVAFLDKHNLHGVDFDWEYPGASDIPGVPPGDASEGLNYLRFLTVLKSLLGDGKRTISVALPSSYWYLRGFPVKEMAKVVNYMVLMTYDLHGQWDYGSQFSNPGYPTGNCLRSHINKTETYSSLALITKAGIPAHKLYIGISSYGRSFRMTDPECTGPACTFTGSFSVSEAEPGQCTATSGYISNAELDSIFRDRHSEDNGLQAYALHTTSAVPFSDMENHGTQGQGITDWVTYMSDETKKGRREWIRGLNFGGTTDWALDLADYYEGPHSEGDWNVDIESPECNQDDWPTSLEGFDTNMDQLPIHCRGMALTRFLAVSMNDAIEEFTKVSEGYDDKFGYYADWVKDAIDSRLDEFLAIGRGKGLHFMDCEWETRRNKGSGPCTEVVLEYDLGIRPGARVVTFTMKDEEGFYAALAESTGIHKDWITWRDDSQSDPCIECGPLPFCPGQAFCADNYYMRRNFPRRIHNKGKINIENPKKIIDEALPKIRELVNIAIDAYMQMRWHFADMDSTDVIESLSMPLFMLQDSFEAIKEIKDIGEKQKDRKTRDLVILILTIVFSVIPFAGPAATALGGAARIATAALIVGEIGNAALAIESIIDDPYSAPFAVLGLLVGAGGIRVKGPRQGFRDAADAKRAMDPGSLKLFSTEFRRKNEIVGRIVKMCII